MITSQLLFIGTTELMLIAGIALLLFGGKEVTEPFEEAKQEVDEVIKE